jgi:tetratricopeptide (TPR) repeat protein
MSDSTMSDIPSPSRDDRIDGLIAEYLQAVEAGRPPDPNAWLEQHADVADELSEFLQDHQMWRQLAPQVTPAGIPGKRPGELPWPRLNGYELVREIGRGGMGVVYEAVELATGHRVAVKVLPAGFGKDATAVTRFQREGEASERLRHPFVVPVHARGCDGGTHYLVMELVDGESLDRVLASARNGNPDSRPRAPAVKWLDDFSAIARHLADVADALQHAHEQGVIHRDVKPSNLLLAADGRLLLGDFGLAQVLAQPSLTRTGEFIGTPSYMSPEQISGNPPLDHRTDLYSLGATMYELLVGQPPFIGESRDEVLAGILQRDSKPPRTTNPAIPRDLETICLKCLEKIPSRRYETARALATDLRRFADGHSIAARRDGAILQIARRVRRSPTIAVIGTAVIVTVVIAALFAWQAAASRQELLDARRQTAIDNALLAAMADNPDETDRAIAEAERVGASPGWIAMLRGQSAYHRGDYLTAGQQLERAVRLLPDSVAARSMLATAQLGAGLWEKYEQSLDDIARRTPKTPHDRLFLGLAESYLDPAQSLPLLDEAIRLRDSPVARLIRSEVRTSQALDTGEPRDAEAALVDANIAREMLPAHPSALIASLGAHRVAAGSFEDAGDEPRSQSMLKQAEHDAQALEPFASISSVAYERAQYYQSVGRDNDAVAELLRAARQSDDVLVQYNLALALCHRGEPARALTVLDRITQPGADPSFLKVWLLGDAGRNEQSLALYRELRERYPGGLTALFRPSLLLLTGHRDEALSDWKSLSAANRLPRLRRAFYEKLLAFNCGDLSEPDLMLAAGHSHWDQCEAHYFVALHQWSLGNEAAARTHFQAAVDRRCVGFMAWDWSRLCLKRLEP